MNPPKAFFKFTGGKNSILKLIIPYRFYLSRIDTIATTMIIIFKTASFYFSNIVENKPDFLVGNTAEFCHDRPILVFEFNIVWISTNHSVWIPHPVSDLFDIPFIIIVVQYAS